jgi:hypothetical protein
MKRWIHSMIWPVIALGCGWSLAAEIDKNVPRIAEAEIARRGPLVERVSGIQAADDPHGAIALAMQPPPDDSYKWLFTLVTTKSCSWCEQMRKDFETDPKLKAWVDTKDYTKSWAHWQIVQIEDHSQAWRWKDFKPTSFPALIVQPPVNGSWGDSHTIVFIRQGYQKPAELDAAIRQAIQLYAAKMYPRRLAWATNSGLAPNTAGVHGLEAEQRDDRSGGTWTPPVTPPAPLPPLPAGPVVPNMPSFPPQYPPLQPDAVSLLSQLLGGLLGGPALANLLLIAILAWQVYRGIAKREGIPLLLDDATAEQVAQLLQSLPKPTKTDAAKAAQ